MSKDRKNPTNKSQVKNPKMPVSKFESYIKMQQQVKNRLQRDLNTIISQEKELHSYMFEKNKIIVELEKSIEQRDAEILKANNEIKLLKENNLKTLQDFSIFKDNFYQLEAQYDQICQSQKRENDELKEKLQNQQTMGNQKIAELTLGCQSLEQQLQEKTQTFLKMDENLSATIRQFEILKKQFEKKQIEFENYKKSVEEKKKIIADNHKFNMGELNKSINNKENIIKKCMEDNENLEKEKNRIIDELNNKIHRIERAFSQPTKAVQPMLSMPSITKTTTDVTSNQINTEKSETSNAFVAVTNSHVSETAETEINLEQGTVNNEIKKPDNNKPPTLRQYKFKRPGQHPTSCNDSNTTSTSNNNNNNNNTNKRKQYSQRDKPPPPGTLTYFEYYTTTSTDDESDEDSICQRQWRPKQRKDECFVPDTSDASEGFAKPKRAKK